MTRGERISVIKRIASTLADESFADIGLTLSQFGIPYDDDFRGGLYEMVLDAAGQADNDNPPRTQQLSTP